MKPCTIGIASHIPLLTALRAAKIADVIIVGEPIQYEAREKEPIFDFPILTTSKIEKPELYDFKRIKKAKRK